MAYAVTQKGRWRPVRLPGAVAHKVVADDETGELEAATILGQFGEVSKDFAESLRGG